MQAWLQANIETFSFADEPQPYVRIRAFVDALGLDWAFALETFRRDDHWGYREGTVRGGGQAAVVEGLPADKLFVFLRMVPPERVREELREAVVDYQETSRRMTERAFLQSDLLAAARAKENPSPLEQKLIQAAELLEQRPQSNDVV